MESATAYWRERAITYGPGWLEHYWASWQAPHRVALADAVGACGTFTSLLELGCHCGPNLRLWRHRWPRVALQGIDVSREAVLYGVERFRGDPWTTFRLADFLTVTSFPEADLIASCYALCYADPGILEPVLARAWAAARKGLVLAEPMAAPGLPVGPCADDIEEWRHDYAEVLGRLGARSLVMLPVDPPADRLNSILIARKEP